MSPLATETVDAPSAEAGLREGAGGHAPLVATTAAAATGEAMESGSHPQTASEIVSHETVNEAGSTSSSAATPGQVSDAVRYMLT